MTCPVVAAIRDAATNRTWDPLDTFVRDQPAQWHVTPVQEPNEYDNYLPLHVAVHMLSMMMRNQNKSHSVTAVFFNYESQMFSCKTILIYCN